MDQLHNRQNFDKEFEIVQFITTRLMNIPKLIKFRSLGVTVVEYGKYSRAKWAHFVYTFVLRAWIAN
jgi:hypothetical protein